VASQSLNNASYRGSWSECSYPGRATVIHFVAMNWITQPSNWEADTQPWTIAAPTKCSSPMP